MRKTPPATLNLLIITILVWLASIAFPARFGIDLTRYLGLHYWQSDAFLPTQLVTYMFMHDTSSMWHIFCNMFGVWMFGRTLESLWGAKKFIFFYFFAGIGAGIVQELTWMIDVAPLVRDFDAAISSGSGESLSGYQHLLIQGDITQATATDLLYLRNQLLSRFVTVGASGALFGVLLAFGWLFPQASLYMLFIPIPIPARIFVGIYAVIELLSGISGAGDGVAHFAHLGGMLFGAILLFIWKKQNKLY
ncbi:MAG: rhomboid family intramembrane serine protease [Paludibacteraceae bacterium]|nr:rhomboid family intramembrane serine protease [Paludibacteraceae bacterium]